MPSRPSQGITRRDLLKKGAALGGAVVWVTPIVQSVGMGRAFAQAPSPTPCDPGISYIAMNVTCGVIHYFIKWETTNGFAGDWEPDAGSVPECESLIAPTGTKFDGELLGFSVDVDSSGTATVTLPQDQIPPQPPCTVDVVVVKGGSNCSQLLGQTGTFTVTCPTQIQP